MLKRPWNIHDGASALSKCKIVPQSLCERAPPLLAESAKLRVKSLPDSVALLRASVWMERPPIYQSELNRHPNHLRRRDGYDQIPCGHSRACLQDTVVKGIVPLPDA